MFGVLIVLILFTGWAAAQGIGHHTDNALSTSFADDSNNTNGSILRMPLVGDTTNITMKNPPSLKSQRQQRQLRIFDGFLDRRCEQLMDNTIENIFSQQDCNCEPIGFPPALVVDCARIQESCILNRPFTEDPDDKLLCGLPGIRFTINVWSIIFAGSPIAAELCLYDASVFNVTLPDILNPVCFGLFTGLPGSVPLASLLELIFGRTASTAKLLDDTSTSSSSLPTRNRKPLSINEKSCVPIVGDNNEKCNSCTICPPEDGGGVIFDCSNVIPNFRSTECTVFPSFE